MNRIVHRTHDGEKFLQQKRGASEDTSEFLEHILQSSMPDQHSEFFSNLMYFPLGTFDGAGSLHATMLCNPQTIIKSSNSMVIKAKVESDEDPFLKALKDPISTKRYVAGVGVDFSNRRRNKVAGYIEQWTYEEGELSLSLVTSQSMGNCPKYITVRKLVPKRRKAEAALLSEFDEECVAILRQASTIFLATRHFECKDEQSKDMGFNHRGGSRGFVRYYKEDGNTFLVIPDFSGNRFYQSLGNVQLEKNVALIIPDFSTGSVLHVSGEAKNLFDEEAEALMPRCSLVTRVKVDSFKLIRNEMSLEMVGPEQYSPYNPPLKFLASESKIVPKASGTKAELIAKRVESKLVSTFVFQMTEDISELLPGQFAIFDFSEVIDKPYMHMNQENPSLVNDDLMRTWTVSGWNKRLRQISITVKLKEGGLVSPLIHSLTNSKKFPFLFKGFGGDFTLSGKVPSNMLWIAGGVGITPFLAFHQYLKETNSSTNVHLIYSCKKDEFSIAERFESKTVFTERRINKDDLKEHLAGKEIYLCGPEGFMDSVRSMIYELEGKESKINEEKFTF